MKTFRHDWIELPKLVRIDKPEGRKYQTPSGLSYPSVTTLLGSMLDKSGLQYWINLVGQEEADRIKDLSGRRGTAIHGLCEDLVANKPIDRRKVMPFNLLMFDQIKDILINHVDDIRVSEGQLYSDKLKVAGSVDLVASFDGKPAVIDFKTSLKLKKKEHIIGYFLQVALYSFMLWERTGIFINDMYILVCIEQEQDPQIFHEKATDWIDQAKDLCKKFHLTYG